MLVCFATPFGKRPSPRHYRSKLRVQASRLDCQFINVEVDLLIVSKARNSITQAIPKEVDVVWFVDSDMELPQGAEVLLNYLEDNPLVSGLYFSRYAPFIPQVYNRIQPGVTSFAFLPVVNIPDKPFYADAVGAGCLLMRRSILDELETKHDEWKQEVRSWMEAQEQELSGCPAAVRALEFGLTMSAHWEFLETCGEDFYFCEQVRHFLDIRPLVVPEVVCLHEGIHWVGKGDWEATVSQRGVVLDATMRDQGGSIG